MPMMISTIGKALPARRLRKNSASISAKKIPSVYDRAYQSSPNFVKQSNGSRNFVQTIKNTDLEMIESEDHASKYERQVTNITEIKNSSYGKTANLIALV